MLAILIATASPALGVQVADEGPMIEVRTLPETPYLHREMSGGYEQHPGAIGDLMRIAAAQGLESAAIMGVYPTGPAVEEDEIRWQIGLLVPAGTEAREGLRLEVLPATLAAVVESRVDRTESDGAALGRWVAEHDEYEPAGATRMIYHAGDGTPQEAPTTIVMPVRRR